MSALFGQEGNVLAFHVGSTPVLFSQPYVVRYVRLLGFQGVQQGVYLFTPCVEVTNGRGCHVRAFSIFVEVVLEIPEIHQDKGHKTKVIKRTAAKRPG